MTENQLNNFATFLFIKHKVTHPVEAVCHYCEYVLDSYIERILEGVILNNDYDEIVDVSESTVRAYLWSYINDIGVELMSVPEEFDPVVVDFYHNHQTEFAMMLYIGLLATYDGMIRHLPSILQVSPYQNWRFGDYRLTTTETSTILRLIRKPNHV